MSAPVSSSRTPVQMLDMDLLSNELVGEPDLVRSTGGDGEASALPSSKRGRMREIERGIITQELTRNRGHRTHRAAKLGISVRALAEEDPPAGHQGLIVGRPALPT